jgi:alanine racemase
MIFEGMRQGSDSQFERGESARIFRLLGERQGFAAQARDGPRVAGGPLPWVWDRLDQAKNGLAVSVCLRPACLATPAHSWPSCRRRKAWVFGCHQYEEAPRNCFSRAQEPKSSQPNDASTGRVVRALHQRGELHQDPADDQPAALDCDVIVMIVAANHACGLKRAGQGAEISGLMPFHQHSGSVLVILTDICGFPARRRPLNAIRMNLYPRARIHLGNIVANWRAIDALAPFTDTGAVVKANAYGHGAVQVGRALYDAGCRTFFVAYADEGAELREEIGDLALIYVFNGAGEDDRTLVQRSTLIPVINSIPALELWMSDEMAPYALHIDTGMNRLGIRPEDVPQAYDMRGRRGPVMVMSHLVDSDRPRDPVNTRQCNSFRQLSAPFTMARKSLSNTGGCFIGRQYDFDLQRPGIGLYGGGPEPSDGIEILPGMTLEAPILTVQQVPAGEAVGYGGEWTFNEPRTLATVALGYGDGFPRSAGNRGFASLGGIHCPIVGRVSMDLITIDVTSAQGLAKPGAFAQFIGSEIRLEDQARRAGTVGYELVTGLGHRVRRIYD